MRSQKAKIFHGQKKDKIKFVTIKRKVKQFMVRKKIKIYDYNQKINNSLQIQVSNILFEDVIKL